MTLIPLKVSTAGKSFSRAGLPNVADGNADMEEGKSKGESRLVPVLVRESDADAISEVAWFVSQAPSKVEVDVAAGLAGLASAGEERAELQSLLATETALLSISASLVELGPVMVGKGGAEEGMEAGRGMEGASSKPPLSSSTAWLSFMDVSSESEADITDDHYTAFNT